MENDWNIWCKRFMHPQTLAKDWNAIVIEEGTDIYTWPMFTEEFCKFIIEEAEHRAKWTVSRHEHYPTTDFLLEELNLGGMYMRVLHEYGIRIAGWLW